MKLIKARQHLVLRHNLSVKSNRIPLEHLYRNVIFYLDWRQRPCSRQIIPDTLHVGLAQANHHETGEEKEHDVDQWNNLNASSFVRNWRGKLHGKSVGCAGHCEGDRTFYF